MNKTTVRVRCPYCQAWQAVLVPLTPGYAPKTIHTCDTEDVPGCDKDFVVDVVWQYNAIPLMIEGEDG